MRYGFVTVKVKDMAESERFYREIIGLYEELRFSYRNGMNILFMSDCNGSLIELIKMEGCSSSCESGKEVSIGFLVDDLDEKIRELKSKNIDIRGPVDVPGGVRFIFIKDPNGVDIELVENFSIDRLR